MKITYFSEIADPDSILQSKFHESRLMNPVFLCRQSIKIHNKDWIVVSGFGTEDWSMSPSFLNADFSMKESLFSDGLGNESSLES